MCTIIKFYGLYKTPEIELSHFSPIYIQLFTCVPTQPVGVSATLGTLVYNSSDTPACPLGTKSQFKTKTLLSD